VVDEHAERVLLEVRLADGLDLAVVPEPERSAVAGLIADGLLEGKAALAGRGRLPLRGRLLADPVVRALLPA
jgi:oxygen-independent coproporphyrinogen-3 oxidase